MSYLSSNMFVCFFFSLSRKCKFRTFLLFEKHRTHVTKTVDVVQFGWLFLMCVNVCTINQSKISIVLIVFKGGSGS